MGDWSSDGDDGLSTKITNMNATYRMRGLHPLSIMLMHIFKCGNEESLRQLSCQIVP